MAYIGDIAEDIGRTYSGLCSCGEDCPIDTHDYVLEWANEHLGQKHGVIVGETVCWQLAKENDGH